MKAGNWNSYIDSDEGKAVFEKLYGRRAESQKERWGKLASHFDADQDIHLFSAPGRTEIGGNHTDHQHGRVLAAAVDLDIAAVACASDDNTVRYISEDFSVKPVDLGCLEVQAEEVNTTESLIRGIASAFVQRGYQVGGAVICAGSEVLPGSGMSSSAAFEVLIASVFSGLYNDDKVDPVEKAIIGQYAENVYFGKASGLMDQTASSCGGCVAIDFKDPAAPVIERIGLDLSSYGLSLVLTDCRQSHADLSGEYSLIPGEMNAAAQVCGYEHLDGVDMELLLSKAAEIRETCGDRALLRAYHFINETQRAKQEADALRNGDIEGLLDLVKASGRSSWMYLQNVSVGADPVHQSLAVGLMLSEQVLKDEGAWRVHGGGFAGTIQAFVPDHKKQEYINAMESVFGEGCCYDRQIRADGGVMLK